jgi:hypothetical protein
MVKLLVGGEKLLSNKVLIEPDLQTENKTAIHIFSKILAAKVTRCPRFVEPNLRRVCVGSIKVFC